MTRSSDRARGKQIGFSPGAAVGALVPDPPLIVSNHGMRWRQVASCLARLHYVFNDVYSQTLKRANDGLLAPNDGLLALIYINIHVFTIGGYTRVSPQS